MKSRRKLLTAGLLAGMLLSLPTAEAGVGTFHAVGEYTMSDYDNPEISEIRALDYARQSAVEQAGVYVGNYTRTVNMQVTDDEIMAISSSNIKITDKQIKRTLLPTGDVRIQAEITATVDTAEIDAILNDKTQKLQEQQRKYLDLKARRDKLESAAQKLKQQIAELKSNDAIDDFEIKEEQERQNRYREAKELANTASEIYGSELDGNERAGEITRKILLLNPKAGEHWAFLGECQLSWWPGDNAGVYEKIAPYMTKALILDPEDLNARRWRVRAYKASSDDNIRKKAIQDLDFLIEREPDAENYRERASAYEGLLGDWQNAIKDYTQAINLAKDEYIKYTYYYRRGYAYERAKMLREALNDYDTSIAMEPNRVIPYYCRVRIYIANEEYDKAIKDYTKLLSIEGETNKRRIYSERAEVYWKLKDYRNIVEDVTHAGNLSDGNVLLFYRGYAYDELGDYGKAIEDYTRLIRDDPNYAAAYNNRGAAYEKMGELEKARYDFEKAVSIENDNEMYKNNLKRIKSKIA